MNCQVKTPLNTFIVSNWRPTGGLIILPTPDVGAFLQLGQRDTVSGQANEEEEEKQIDQALKGAFTNRGGFKGNIHSAEFLEEKAHTLATPPYWK